MTQIAVSVVRRANDDAIKLAKGLHAALEKMAIAKD